jgi:hypothetical protein
VRNGGAIDLNCKLTHQITVARNLHGAQDGNIDVTTSNHTETLRTVEDGSSRKQGDGLFTGVDDVAGDATTQLPEQVNGKPILTRRLGPLSGKDPFRGYRSPTAARSGFPAG